MHLAADDHGQGRERTRVGPTGTHQLGSVARLRVGDLHGIGGGLHGAD